MWKFLQDLFVGSPRLIKYAGPGWQADNGPGMVVTGLHPRQVGPPCHLQVSSPKKGSDTDSCTISENGVLWPQCKEASKAPGLEAAGEPQVTPRARLGVLLCMRIPGTERPTDNAREQSRIQGVRSTGFAVTPPHSQPLSLGAAQLSLFGCHSSAVTLRLSLFGYHSSAVTLWLSLFSCHSLAGEGTVVLPGGLKVGSPGGHS